MTILHSPYKRRTNRLVTNKAIQAVTEFINGSDKRSWNFGNTSAHQTPAGDLVVYLFGQPILKLECKDNEIDAVCVYTGGKYDEYGNPTMLTLERLNGLLDALGHEGIVPKNTRVYYDRDYSVCYLINMESKVALNKDYCTMAALKSDPCEFVIVRMDIVNNGAKED